MAIGSSRIKWFAVCIKGGKVELQLQSIKFSADLTRKALWEHWKVIFAKQLCFTRNILKIIIELGTYLCCN